ncbi:MAG: threonylcarbamoyl-AMP synthase [Planctomycetes bacterium]|nr:threonylcarbamoyl-AMP synthase [Planctomycetota bacterium]
MPCDVLRLNADSPEADAIARASRILLAGGLVAFPTETVYGLGANALDSVAVGRIFSAKGRPALNPIIVHVAAKPDAKKLVTDWPAQAEKLADQFWPGPLTLVLPKAACVPDLVTAGGPTVAVRVPAHPVALALLRKCDVPLAAPSANRSTELSPTRAEHVMQGLAGRIDLVLDAGPTLGGLESTVLDLTTDPPRLLRPGLVTAGQIQAVIGAIVSGGSIGNGAGPLRSPGQMVRHYAPKTPLEVLTDSRRRVADLRQQGLQVGWLTWRDFADAPAGATLMILPGDAAGYSTGLYAALHQLDQIGPDQIVVETPPNGEEWLAVHDRLRRATTRS